MITLEKQQQTKTKNFNTMKKTILLAAIAFCCVVAKAAEPFDGIMGRIQAENEGTYSVTSLDATVAKHLSNQLATGRFSDINYADTEGRTKDWESLMHIDHTKDMAFAYTMPASSYFESTELYDKIVLALNSWVNNHPTVCSNWWFNDIPEPQRLGILLIQLRKGKRQEHATLEASLITNRIRPGWSRGSAYFTGANRTDVATAWVYGYCLTENTTGLRTAVTEVYQPLAFVTGEGLQYDFSYFQHGNQLYIGGYGDELIKGNTLIASYVAGTGYDMPEAKRDLLSTFMRNTWLPSIRGEWMFWNITGRGMSRPGTIHKKGEASIYVERMISIDPDNAEEFRAALKRMRGEEAASYAVEPRGTHFFRGDYTLHVRPQFSVDLRLLSTRTKTIECGNSENLKNYYLSDGSMSITTHGKEYGDIFPTWSWTRIPGVTSPQVPTVGMGGDMGATGTSTFAGGASDSLYSVSAYTYTAGTNGTVSGNKTGVGGSKGWFFFDNEVVCLGTNLTSDVSVQNYNIFTTLNQCHRNGTVSFSVNSHTDSLPAGEEIQLSSPNWVLHDGVAYLFPNGGSVGVVNKTQSGTWYDINHSYSRDTVKHNVFTLYLDHGKQISKAKYAYIIAPGLSTAAEVDAYNSRRNIRILSNTDNIQAVKNTELNIWQIIFYVAGTFNDGEVTITADRPCALILKRKGVDYTLHVADPGQRGVAIKITANLPFVNEQVVKTFSFASGTYAGATQATSILGNTENVMLLDITTSAGITVLSPVGVSPYVYIKNTPVVVQFVVLEGYENPEVKVNGALTGAVLDGGIYGVRLSNTSEDIALTISAKLKSTDPDPDPETAVGDIDPNDPVVSQRYYTLMGQEVREPTQTGVYIVKRTHASKKVSVRKQLITINY
jgi:chondroitin AC lyase